MDNMATMPFPNAEKLFPIIVNLVHALPDDKLTELVYEARKALDNPEQFIEEMVTANAVLSALTVSQHLPPSVVVMA